MIQVADLDGPVREAIIKRKMIWRKAPRMKQVLTQPEENSSSVSSRGFRGAATKRRPTRKFSKWRRSLLKVQNLENKFRQRVRDLIGARCSAVHGTSGVGSMITILFGPRRMTSVTLPSFGTFEHDSSDISINLESAAWRLEEGEKGVWTSRSQNGVASPMDFGLRKLEAENGISVD